AFKVDTLEIAEAEPEPITNEHIKAESNFLRGTIVEGLQDATTGALSASDTQLTKFHGIYQQDDRDIRDESVGQGIEPAYSFMIRVRMPGGVCDSRQWLQMDQIPDEHGCGNFKVTTRQTFQFHGVIKRHLKSAIKDINRALLDTLAACGDVNRNVTCSLIPSKSKLHAQVYEFAKQVSEHLLPHTTTYHEIWLDKKRVADDALKDFEPLYGDFCLPRKFKVSVAMPPTNDVEVFLNDLGYIAIVGDDGELQGFNVSIGGGMGVMHGNKKTYPRRGAVIGFCMPKQGKAVAEKAMLVQRNHGNRAEYVLVFTNAGLNYTVNRLGVDGFREEVEKLLGWKGEDRKHHFMMYIENVRVEDVFGREFKTGLREFAKVHKGTFRLTTNQHLMLSDIVEEDLPQIKGLLTKCKLDNLKDGQNILPGERKKRYLLASIISLHSISSVFHFLAATYGTRSNAPYAVLEASQYGIAANHLHNDEVFAEKMTHLEHARGSSRFAFINGASRRPSAISLDVLSNLSEGRVVVVENLPKGDLPLDAQLIQDTLHIRTDFTVDVTDAVLRTYPEHAREPFRRLSVADMARLAQDVRSPPLAILDLHAPIQQYNPLLEFVSDCHETLKSPAGNVYNSVGVLRGTNRLSQWAVFNSGPHVTPLHHDASAFATSFQVHADCAKFWGICLLDSSTVQSLGELCDIYTTVVEQEDITFDTPEAERRGVRFYVLDVRAGVTVFTNPGTIHFVYTPKATVMTGGHFMSVDLAHFVEFGRFRERREEQLREKRRKAAQEAGVEIDDDDGSHGAIGFMEDDIYAQDLLVQAMLCLHAHLRPIRRKPLISLCRMVAYPLQYLPAVPEGKNAAGEEPSRHRQYWNQKSHRAKDLIHRWIIFWQVVA
ncbi:hypothetical protein K525DRAFT_274827, partial [Schizophyllum commune Loenen D]